MSLVETGTEIGGTSQGNVRSEEDHGADEATAREAVQQMHGRNYHGRDITCNVAKPRGPDPKKDGTYHTSERYTGKYDAGGRLKAEFRGTSPFAVMFQKIEQAAMRDNVQNVNLGGATTAVSYWPITK